MPDTRPALLGLPFDALAALLGRIGVGAVHAGRVFRALHRYGEPLERTRNLRADGAFDGAALVGGVEGGGERADGWGALATGGLGASGKRCLAGGRAGGAAGSARPRVARR